MPVLYDRILPRKPAAIPSEGSELTDPQIAIALIDRIAAGVPEVVAELEVLSIATGTRTTPCLAVRRVLRKIRADVEAMKAVDPCAYDDAAAYRAALDAASNLIPSLAWVNAMRDAYSVVTFAELKAAILVEHEASPL